MGQGSPLGRSPCRRGATELPATGRQRYGTKLSGPPEAIAVGMIWNPYSPADKQVAISTSNRPFVRYALKPTGSSAR